MYTACTVEIDTDEQNASAAGALFEHEIDSNDAVTANNIEGLTTSLILF